MARNNTEPQPDISRRNLPKFNVVADSEHKYIYRIILAKKEKNTNQMSLSGVAISEPGR